jgi:hypothetical protein
MWDTIYISDRGRLFRRRKKYVKPQGENGPEELEANTDKLLPVGNDQLAYGSASGFKFRQIMGDDEKKATIVITVKILVTRNGSGLNCTVSESQARLAGATKSISYNSDGSQRIMHGSRVTQSHCTITKGKYFCGIAVCWFLCSKCGGPATSASFADFHGLAPSLLVAGRALRRRKPRARRQVTSLMRRGHI